MKRRARCSVDLMPRCCRSSILAVGAMVLLLVGVDPRRAQRASASSTARHRHSAAGRPACSSPCRRAPSTLFDGSFVVDGFARFAKMLTLLGSAARAAACRTTISTVEKQQKFEFPVLVLLATLGMMLMVSAGDFIALYLGLELQSLALYVLAAFNRDNRRARPKRA